MQTVHSFVTAASVEDIFQSAGVPTEFDVLSIDVDSQDWWIWRAISRYHPRVVIIEYNADLSAERLLAEPEGYENPNEGFTSYFGASIGAFKALSELKGYRLVYTELTGANAFFVRRDLPGAWADPDRVQLRGLNYRLNASGHPPDALRREYVDVMADLPEGDAVPPR